LAVVAGKHEKDAVGKSVQKNYYLDVHFETESESIDTYLNTNKRRYDTLTRIIHSDVWKKGCSLLFLKQLIPKNNKKTTPKYEL